MDRSCSLLHGQPRQPFEWNYFPILTERIVLPIKKRNLRKYSVVFFLKHFPKKRYFADPLNKSVFLYAPFSNTSVSCILLLLLLIFSFILDFILFILFTPVQQFHCVDSRTIGVPKDHKGFRRNSYWTFCYILLQ